MAINSINSAKPSFGGDLILGGHLSKNFEKSVPVLKEMIKDKPYDVFVRGIIYPKGKRRAILPRFQANSYGYMEKTGGLEYMDAYAPKARHGSYKNAMQNLINKIDEKISQKNMQKTEPLTFKQKLTKSVKDMYNLLFNY